MSRRAQLCRAVVVLYLAFAAAFTLFQIYRAIDWPSTIGLMIRLSILVVFVWQILARPRAWSLGLGLLLLVESMATAIKLYSIAHHSALPILIVSGTFVSRTTIFWLFCVAPTLSALACFTLFRSLRRPEYPSPTAGAVRRV